MNRRESTNVKLAAIINAKDNDQEEEAAVINEEQKAKQRLRRSSLYGGGARTRIPKIKKSKKIEESPYQTSGAPPPAVGPKPFEHSIPPGAHGDQFRVVANPTQRSRNDPDRVCINSSSMMEGLQVVHQPPWYVGNNNKIKPADTNHFIAASRYGFRGSRQIQQYSTEPWEVPSKTRTEHTPKFLNNSDNYINEWVPPIFAAKQSTINGIETPKLWPQNTEYVTGYPLKKYPTSWIYKRETTVDLPERPKSSDALSTLMTKTIESNSLLKKYARMETTKSHASLPIAAQTSFEENWKMTLKSNASASLKAILKREKPLYEAHTLMDPSDAIKYSGSTAMIVHTQSTDELKFRLRMERSKSVSKTPFQLKWQHVIIHYSTISKKLKKGYPMRKAIRSIAKALRAAAMRNGSETSLRRIDFINACQDISYFDEVTSKQLSLLYSLFDPMKRNVMRYVEFVGLLTVLDMPEQMPDAKIRSLWLLHQEFGLDRNLFDIVTEILSCCASSVPDCHLIEKYFAEEFRPQCYEQAVTGGPKPALSRPGTSSEMLLLTGGTNTGLSTRGGTPANMQKGRSVKSSTANSASSRVNSQALVVVDSDSDDDGLNETKTTKGGLVSGTNTMNNAGMMPKLTTGLSVQPQYNICEHFLNEHTLVQVLAECPNLMATFDAQLSARLIACHGSDDRYKEAEDDQHEEENHDFTWIMKKREHKKEVFGLF
eukprot:gene22485-25478_t